MEEDREDKQRGSLLRQMLCAAVINSVSLLQGASVSTSSIILHELQNSDHHNHSDHTHHVHHDNCTDHVHSCRLQPETDLGPFLLFNDFHITQEEGSWIGSTMPAWSY